MALFYTGIGSRSTPPHVLQYMTLVAAGAAQRGWVLRSGGAPGADSAFEAGALQADGAKEIYLPWDGFGGRTAASTSYPGYFFPGAPLWGEAAKLAQKYHPAWDRVGRGERALHTRNVFQVLGRDLNTPSNFVLCWTDPDRGGTTQALRIARDYEIPIFNLWLAGGQERFEAYWLRGVGDKV